MPWWDWQESTGIPHRENFSYVNDFFSDIDWNEYTPRPVYWATFGFAEAVEEYYNVNYGATVSDDLSIYPTDITHEVGWMHNGTVDWGNVDYTGSVLNPGSCNSQVAPQGQGSVKFRGLNWPNHYEIDMYNPYNGNWLPSQDKYLVVGDLSFNVNFSTSDYLGNTSTNEAPDYAYYIHPITFAREINDSNIYTLPNDTVYLPMDSLTFTGTNDVEINTTGLSGNFNWNFGNGETSTLSSPKFIYDEVGEYPVTMKYSDSTGKKLSVERTYVVLDSRQQNMGNNEFTIAPNPTSGTFTISSKNDIVPDDIEILDVLGKICFNEANPKMRTFDISSLAPGTYVVKIKYGGYVYIKKLVKY